MHHMSSEKLILCDGCGQVASPEHLARRLQRLELTTRYRPIHIQTLLLGAVSPPIQSDFLYSPDLPPTGEAARLFEAASVSTQGKSVDTLHAEFQRRGLFVTHMLECPLEPNGAGAPASVTPRDSATRLQMLLAARIPAVLVRIRRSLKPRRVALISPALTSFIDQFSTSQIGCELLVDGHRSFELEDTGALARLRASLAATVTR